MTESDKSYISSEFAAMRELLKVHNDNACLKMQGIEKWVCSVEKKTDYNSKLINYIIGGLILASAIIGVIELSIKP